MNEGLKAFLEAHLVPWLNAVLAPVHSWLNAIPPFGWRVAVCLYLVVGSLWTLALRRSSVYAGAPDQAVWRDLRWWVPLVLLPYLLLYLFV